MIPMSLRVVLVPENGAEIEPPGAWLTAAREGMVMRAEFNADTGAINERLDAIEQRQTEIEAGTNIVVTPDGDGVLRIHAQGGVASYRDVTEGGPLTAEDNGRVVEVDSADGVVLTVPAGLPRGWTCLVRQVGQGAVTVARDAGVVFVPTDEDLSAAAPWQEIALESQGDDVAIARLLT